MSKYYTRTKCSHPECRDHRIVGHRTRAEEKDYLKRKRPYTCSLHSSVHKIVSESNPVTTEILTVVETHTGKYFQKECGRNTSGFQSGNGYKMWADHFKVGDKIKITAELL